MSSAMVWRRGSRTPKRSPFFQMQLRFVRLAVLQQGLPQKTIGVRIAGLDSKRLFIMSDRFRQVAEPMKTDCEIVVRQRAVWFALHNIPIVRDGFVELPGI